MTTVLKQVYANTQFSPVGEKNALISKLDPKLVAAADSASDAVEEVVKPDYLLMKRVEQAFHLLNISYSRDYFNKIFQLLCILHLFYLMTLLFHSKSSNLYRAVVYAV